MSFIQISLVWFLMVNSISSCAGNLPRASGKIDEYRLKRAKAELRGKLLLFIPAYR